MYLFVLCLKTLRNIQTEKYIYSFHAVVHQEILTSMQRRTQRITRPLTILRAFTKAKRKKESKTNIVNVVVPSNDLALGEFDL